MLATTQRRQRTKNDLVYWSILVCGWHGVRTAFVAGSRQGVQMTDAIDDMRKALAALPGKLYAVECDDEKNISDGPPFISRGKWEDGVTTLSPVKDVCGWRTDSGCAAYGMSKEAAEAIVALHKAAKRLVKERGK